MDLLFPSPAIPRLFEVEALRELGAYEALWLDEHTTFKSIARLFGKRPGARASDFVPAVQADEVGRLALELVGRARIGPFEFLTRGSALYPARLREAADPVEVLYCEGRTDMLGHPSIAIVGTRRPSPAGALRARRLARYFARAGLDVISGLAVGIDTIAHQEAIAAGGQTAAVLGTPLTASYPPVNTALQRRLARDFLVASQVPIVRYTRQRAAENRRFFRDRDATLAALARAVVIVEASDRSGALICARHALELGRPVYIPDSCCRDATLTWPGRLLRAGAVRARAIEEIDEHLRG